LLEREEGGRERWSVCVSESELMRERKRERERESDEETGTERKEDK